jgi:hypothetical protein
MSYSLSSRTAADINDQIDEYLATTVADSDNQPTTEVTDHLTAAKQAIATLAAAIGRPDDELVVTISGHANPDHAPRDGWADEFISISVSVRRPDAPAPSNPTA